MAKLEELVTPTELLTAIKEGVMKQEIVKKYKASEQELAMMLLPLYRRGELTKEEFNDFFKGASPKKEEVGPEAVPSKTEEPPSEILKSLSKIFGKKSQEEKQPPAEETSPPSLTPELKEVEAAVPEIVPSAVLGVAIEAASETAAQAKPETAEEAPETFEDPSAAEELSMAEEPAPLPPAVEPPAEAETVAAHSQGGSTSMDSAGISGLLNSIFSKLSSIDRRLAAIEKKVLGE